MNGRAQSELQTELERAAANLRPSNQSFVPVLGIAHRLGSAVYLRFEKSLNRPSAHVDLATRPATIRLFRRSTVNGERSLEQHEDHLLTCRERFSIAHELGHLVAFTAFGILPAKDKSTYWAHEELMHRFAGTLLTPDSVIDQCLEYLREGEPLSPFVLQETAMKRARLSQEVLATQLCIKRETIGFMKMALGERKRDRKPVLRVLFAKCGKGLYLPNNHTHLHHEHLLARLSSTEIGTARLPACQFGDREPQDLNISWRCAGSLKSTGHNNANSPIYWVSLAKHCYQADRQLSLW